MKPSLLSKLQNMVERREEIAGELSTPEVLGDPDKFRRLSQEYAQLGPLVESFSAYRSTQDEIESLDAMLGDPEMRE
ncbi:PCRF domain-containing protein, partial [Hydrocarboniphaga effusa]